MAGRPKKEDCRDNQYRVRLNDNENEMLEYVSKMNEKKKSDVFRQALIELYEKTKLAEARKDFSQPDEEHADEYEPTWEDEHVSLQRAIECPYCGHIHMMDFSDECSTSSSERSMGSEIMYEFELDGYECDNCGKPFNLKGYICEYPVGCYNYEEIDVEKIDDEED